MRIKRFCGLPQSIYGTVCAMRMCHKKLAFTLAEVLITLGIIGVVSAITIPTLIQKHQKQVWTTQLKETVSILGNAFNKATADDGVDLLPDTQLFKSVNVAYRGDGNYAKLNQSAFNTKLAEYIKFVHANDVCSGDNCKMLSSYKYMSGYPLTDNMVRRIDLANGTIIYLQIDEVSDSDLFGTVYLDVNGEKGPNVAGRDWFYYEIYQTKPYLRPAWYNNWDTGWAKDFCGHKDETGNITLKGNYQGINCAARLEWNGWVMDY